MRLWNGFAERRYDEMHEAIALWRYLNKERAEKVEIMCGRAIRGRDRLDDFVVLVGFAQEGGIGRSVALQPDSGRL